MQFTFRARDQKGELISGETDAESADALKAHLFEQGFIPIQVKEMKAGAISIEAVRQWFERVSHDELMIFTRQFHTLFRAGVSIDTILSTLAKQGLSPGLQSAIERVRQDVGAGKTISQAFRAHPKVFSELYVSMVSAGEEAGILEQTLGELVDLLEKDAAIVKSIKSATLYPKIVLFVMTIATMVLMTMVVPKFESFYDNYNAELPMATQMLIWFSKFVRNYWWIGLSGVAAFVVVYRKYEATKSGKYKLDQLRFKVPVFGKLNLKVANARFGHILSALYKSGMSMSRSLQVVSKVIGNEAYGMEVRQLTDAIQRGSGLAEAMGKRKYFPVIVIETTAVGERTGALDDMLSAIADHFELEVNHMIKNLTTLLEPIILVVIFSMVAVMALAIFMPIINMSSIVGG